MAATLLSPQYRRVSIVIYSMVAISAFESLAVVAAFPEIAEDLGDVSLLPWVATAYLLSNTISSASSGALIDTAGVRLVFRVGVSVFIVGLVLAVAAPSMALLVAARVVQGIGGGLLFACTLATVPLAYPPGLVQKAFAANSTIWGIMGFAGPGIAAILLTVLSWRWIFVVVIPLGLLAMVLAWKTLPGPVVEGQRRELDVRGVVLLGGAFGGLVLFVGQLTWLAVPWLGLGVVAWLAYMRHAARTEHPVMRIRHLVSRPLGFVNAGIALLLTGGIAAYLFTSLYVRAGRDGSEALAAFSVLFVTVGWTVGSNVSVNLARRMSLGHIVTLGPAFCATALGITAVTVVLDAPLPVVFAALTLVGGGIGVTTTSSLTMLRFVSTTDQIGRITTAHDFCRNTGFTIGNAVAGSVMLIVMSIQLGDVDLVQDLLAGELGAASQAARDAVTSGYATALGVGAIIVALAIPFMWRLRGIGVGAVEADAIAPD